MPMNRRELLSLSGAALLGMSLHPSALLAAPVRASTTPPSKSLRILILGGTGFTGPYQVEYALARGHHVTLFNRGRQPHKWSGPVEELIGDRSTGDLKALEGREWDVCIDNPTSLPSWVRDAGKVLHGKIRQYVFISTISVYESDAKPEDENGHLAPYKGANAMAETMETLRANVNDLYGPLKALSERESHHQFPGITTIIRPGLIVGPGDETDRFTYWPVRLARGGEVLAPGDGSDPVQIIDARDLAEWTIRMVESRTFGTFNADGPRVPMLMGEMLAIINDAVHGHARPVWVPTKFLESQKIEAWSDMPVWIPAEGDEAGAARRSIRRALAAGLTFRPLSTTAVDTLKWFHEQTPERQAKLRAGLTPEREAAALAAWRATVPAASS